ncbi:GNAT family N-acetyltransferase [bacterium]|nr:GNAT family N-acetyltransferase [bacterium]
MSLLVRWATRWDRKAIAAMVGELARQHGVEPDESRLGTAFEYALAHPSQVRYAVAQQGDEVVGTVVLCDAYSTWQAAPYGTIEDFYVVPEARGQGVGTELLELMVQEARKRGYCRVELQVQEDNDSAWKFYESRGLHFTGHLVYARDLREDEQEA